MHRLIVNPGTDSAWEIPLREGIISLGRGEDNDFPIEHPSVSSAHCQIIVMDSGVTIKDLGSANGTLVNGALMEETSLTHGQTIQLGDVAMQFESIPTVATKPALAASAPASAFCRFHPKNPARFFCPKCSKSFCEVCVSTRHEGVFCRSCSAQCIRLEKSPDESFESDQSFFSLIRGAFKYPLKGDGVMLLIGGGIFFLLIDGATFFAKFAFIYGLMALLFLTVFGVGYLTSFLRRILTSTAIGENRMPDWPDITDFGSDIFSPFIQLLGTVFFCFAPAILLTIFATAGNTWLGWAVTACILFGCAYFPMAFTAVAMFDSVTAVNPLLVIPSILKIPLEYLLTIIIFAVILLVRWLGEAVLPELVPIPFLPAIFANFFGLYLLTVEMRILGLLYLTKKRELGWFNN
ncbi:MAG: FHA domain-containing protein [Limisphaerales bacterium]